MIDGFDDIVLYCFLIVFFGDFLFGVIFYIENVDSFFFVCCDMCWDEGNLEF